MRRDGKGMQEKSNILPKTKARLRDIVPWGKFPWKKYQTKVEKIQRSIYHEAKCDNWKQVRDLQRLLLHSWAAKAIAVKKITQINEGKRTAGLDGRTFDSDEARLELLSEIDTKFLFSSKYKPTPIRRVYIPKPDGSKRPLGIPTIKDRIYQELCKMALETEWESKFHQYSYGFRPGRGCQDAIETIKRLIQTGHTHILDADLHGCFDNLSHEHILNQLPPTFKNVVKKWLKTDVVNIGQLEKQEAGTPQGGVISPLLANIALDTLDHVINDRRGIKLIRYADDFLVMSRTERMLNEAKDRLLLLLEKVGPSLNETKTVITTPKNGFSFLGFHFVKYPRRSLWVQPDKKRVQRFLRKLKDLIWTHKQVKTMYLIAGLNSRIRGWTNYYRFSRTHGTYAKMDHILWRWIWAWCKRRHPNKGKRWIFDRYYMGIRNQKWRLTEDGFVLRSFYDTKRSKYSWNVGNLSPFDPKRTIQELWEKKKKGDFYIAGFS